MASRGSFTLPKRARREYTPRDIKQVKAMAGIGLGVEHIAALIGTNQRDFEEECHRNDELCRALEEGRATGLSNVTRTAYQMAISGDQPGMTQFFLKVRGGWKETSALELTGKNGGPLQSENVTREERQERIKAKIKKLQNLDE